MLDLLLQGKTATEIAEQLDVNKATVSRTLLRAKKVLNDKAEDLRQEDLREHPNRLDLAEPETARYVLSRLTETQAVYLYLYYGEWLDMRSIGALLGVDHSTVCRTIHRAAGRIRALCTDGSGVELLGVDALEPALYALYRAARGGRSDPGAGQSCSAQGRPPPEPKSGRSGRRIAR